jgi:hypothetical protein
VGKEGAKASDCSQEDRRGIEEGQSVERLPGSPSSSQPERRV